MRRNPAPVGGEGIQYNLVEFLDDGTGVWTLAVRKIDTRSCLRRRGDCYRGVPSRRPLDEDNVSGRQICLVRANGILLSLLAYSNARSFERASERVL